MILYDILGQIIIAVYCVAYNMSYYKYNNNKLESIIDIDGRSHYNLIGTI